MLNPVQPETRLMLSRVEVTTPGSYSKNVANRRKKLSRNPEHGTDPDLQPQHLLNAFNRYSLLLPCSHQKIIKKHYYSRLVLFCNSRDLLNKIDFETKMSSCGDSYLPLFMIQLNT